MFEMLDNPGEKNAITLLAIVIIAIFLSGIFFGLTYFVMDNIQTQLLTVDCDLGNNVYYSTCQEWFEGTLYKVLDLKTLLISFSYIFIFTLVIGMLILGYKSGKNPVLIGVLFLVSIVTTYGGILIGNLYRSLLDNPLMYEILTPFTIYNKIMLNFPWFVGILSLISIALSIVNYQRSQINTSFSDLNY